MEEKKTVANTLLDDKKVHVFMQIFNGIFHVSMGVLFFLLKPYKKVWMSNVDGIIFGRMLLSGGTFQ